MRYLAERANTAHGRQWVSLYPASLTFCRVSVSASPAQSPVFSHLASSLQGLWTIRAYKAEQRFQKLFDSHQDLHSGLWVSGDDFKDGMCCRLRPDLPLRWSCWPAPLSVLPHVPLCTLASPTPSSQHPICAPLFPLFPRPTSIVLPSQSPVAFCPFRTGVSILFFYFFKQQIVNILDFVCHSISVVTQLCCCSTKPAKLIHQQKHMTVFQ